MKYTNDDTMEFYDKIEFLLWLNQESFNPVDASEEEVERITNICYSLEAITRKWLKYRFDRKMKMIKQKQPK